ncbi:DUF4822 domain-containing protein [Nocardioides panzhihuensis]|uniref:ABC-type glycerol-3-phosphate transport system substrate-binding protein n=1 Tax=Nocardioides panzhihuensis TaxID=860243 RepID=A0A7Z0ISU4_9ACTN|nr:DUF4822 domain-containing protein [Nocardioides panzhihuensis]NYI78469.1 ABC-type glycerol-3-phosphate transport system substrate-binding protein [Nocardioides panzhihuensis]
MKNSALATNPVRFIATSVAALATAAVLAACGATDGASTGAEQAGSAQQAESTLATPSDVLASTAWETTGAVDQDGKDVPLTDEEVSTFVGWAYFDADGTFSMYNLDDTPKMQGDWTVTEDGQTRHIVAKDGAGEVMFERDSDIVTLTEDEFTYRVFPDENDKSVYLDIVHTPTDHAEPTA